MKLHEVENSHRAAHISSQHLTSRGVAADALARWPVSAAADIGRTHGRGALRTSAASGGQLFEPPQAFRELPITRLLLLQCRHRHPTHERRLDLRAVLGRDPVAEPVEARSCSSPEHDAGAELRECAGLIAGDERDVLEPWLAVYANALDRSEDGAPLGSDRSVAKRVAVKTLAA